MGARTAIVLSTAALFVSGAAPFPAERAVLRLVRTPAPASRALAAGVADVAFLDATTGFAVTVAANAAVNGGGVGRLERTRDGGVSWATVWSRPRTSLNWIGFAGARTVFAAGVTYPAGYPRDRAPLPLLLRSGDGGQNWQMIRPSVPPAVRGRWGGLGLRFVDAEDGFAIDEPDVSWGASGLLRTVDGGLHWTLVPERFSGLDFVDARRGFATGARGRSSCVFATGDGGRSWRVLVSSCRRFDLAAVDFVDTKNGFAGGGTSYFAANRPRQALIATHDGGRSWRTVFDATVERRPGLPIVRLAMADARHGLAVTGGCKSGQNAPCGGAVLATADGGHSWRDTGESAGQVAIAGATRAWVVPPCFGGCGVIWQTRDGGRSWQPLARPDNVAFSSVTAAGSWLLADSAAGLYRSLDGGQSWSRYVIPVPAGTQPWQLRIARPGLDLVVGQTAFRVSHDGGRSWHTATLPLTTGFGISAVAFADARHGLASQEGFGCLKGGGLERSQLFATADGGLSWKARPTPPFAIKALAGAAGLWVAITEGAACSPYGVAVSRDGGRSWTVQPIPHLWDCTPSVAAPETIWLACGAALITTTNGGASWTQLSARRFQVASAAAPGWLVGGPPGETATLWQTTTNARTLHARWPAP